jgi:hypothetical protein
MFAKHAAFPLAGFEWFWLLLPVTCSATWLLVPFVRWFVSGRTGRAVEGSLRYRLDARRDYLPWSRLLSPLPSVVWANTRLEERCGTSLAYRAKANQRQNGGY